MFAVVQTQSEQLKILFLCAHSSNPCQPGKEVHFLLNTKDKKKKKYSNQRETFTAGIL